MHCNTDDIAAVHGSYKLGSSAMDTTSTSFYHHQRKMYDICYHKRHTCECSPEKQNPRCTSSTCTQQSSWS